MFKGFTLFFKEIRESTLQGRFFIDSEPEFCPPDQGVVDFAQIDAILVSNYMTLLALPYITEETGFRGAIYMTEPTLHFGRLFMEETIEFLEQVCSHYTLTEINQKPFISISMTTPMELSLAHSTGLKFCL